MNKDQHSNNENDLQQIIFKLQHYWAKKGCIITPPLDIEVGAATFHPNTFLQALGPNPWRVAYLQTCRRPTDGRYGDSPNRLQQYYQFQVVLKPSPLNIQDLYLDSLKALNIDLLQHDIRFVEDNWESPSLGAWGLGFEVWQDGMEITQFTYFQQVGGLECQPIMGELTYGLERLALYLQGKDNVYDLVWGQTDQGIITYGDLFLQNEQQMSTYQFEYADANYYLNQFDFYEQQSQQLTAKHLLLPAYEMMLKASHIFNLVDARGAIAVTQRQAYLLRLRTLAKAIATIYVKQFNS